MFVTVTGELAGVGVEGATVPKLKVEGVADTEQNCTVIEFETVAELGVPTTLGLAAYAAGCPILKIVGAISMAAIAKANAIFIAHKKDSAYLSLTKKL